MLELIVEHQAGIPVLMQPRSGNTHDGVACGQVLTEHVQQLQAARQVTSLVADRALDSAETLNALAASGLQWLTRVPATLQEAREVLAPSTPSTMTPLTEGYRSQERSATYADVAQRWMVIYSEARQARVQRTVEKQVSTASTTALKAFKKLCRTAFACAADAPQALQTFQHRLQATRREGATLRAVASYGKRGRPPPDPVPETMTYMVAGALASSLAYRQGLLDAKSCCILATNECAITALSAAEALARYKSQSLPERGFRFLQAPQFLASSFYGKKPECVMALLMVLTVCLLVYAALEYRIRQTLSAPQETFPDQKGRRGSSPTARWVFYSFVGIHILLGAAREPIVLNLRADHQLILRLLGTVYEALYS
jgi:transposase